MTQAAGSFFGNLGQQAQDTDPKRMFIYSYPKIGKTEALTKLPDTLIVDFEDGTRFYNTPSVFKVNTLNDLFTLQNAFRTEGKRFKRIILDPLTKLDAGIVNTLALQKYYNDEGLPENKRIWNKDIMTLPYGKGSVYKKEAHNDLMKFFEHFCDTLIVVAHVTESKTVNSSTGQEVNSKDIALEGKSKLALIADAEAVGYFYRDPNDKNRNILSFEINENVVAGTRSPRLSGKTFVISERVSNEDGSYTLKTYWEQIFMSL